MVLLKHCKTIRQGKVFFKREREALVFLCTVNADIIFLQLFCKYFSSSRPHAISMTSSNLNWYSLAPSPLH